MKKNLLAVLGVGLLMASQPCWAISQLLDFAYRRQVEDVDSRPKVLDFFTLDNSASALQSGTFDQKIDHDSATDARTFKQRYYLDSSYASGPDSPVFYYICGEATCNPTSLGGAMAVLGKKFHAHLVALEHRYYGKSQPFAALTNENLRYLRTDLALKDLARFQEFARDRLGLRGKWITIGGSYAGSLSAYYRQKFPTLAVGALASSGPVQARENFQDYDRTVADRVGARCGESMRLAVRTIEQKFEDPAETRRIRRLFESESIESSVDFIYIVADMGAMAVQYGMKDQFCDQLTGGSDPVAAYAAAGLRAFRMFGITPEQDSFDAARSTNPDDYLTGFGMRQWLWQSCTEYGYWQNAYADPAHSVRSAMINPEYHRQVCERLFSVDQISNETGMNSVFYRPLLNPATASRIFYTNGSMDPWATLSISSENGNAVNPATPTALIQGGAHCDDLSSPRVGDSSSLMQARKTFEDLVTEWLR